MTIEDSQSPNSGRIVNRGMLIALDILAVFSLEGQELDVNLNLMPRDFLVIAGRMDLPQSYPSREVVQFMTFEDAIAKLISRLDHSMWAAQQRRKGWACVDCRLPPGIDKFDRIGDQRSSQALPFFGAADDA